MIVVNKQSRLEHKITIHQKSVVEITLMCTWCHQQFGWRFSIVDRETFGRDGRWQCTWDGPGLASYTFQFDHGEDAVLFALRWL